MPSKETSQVLYFFSTTLHSSKMISFKGVSGPFRNGFVHNLQFPDIRRALTFANTFKAEKMAELKELDEF